MLVVGSADHVLTTARVDTDMGSTGEDWLAEMRLARLQERCSGLIHTYGTPGQNYRPRKDFGKDLSPLEFFDLVEVLEDELEVELAVGDVHLNALLTIVNEEVVRGRALQLVGHGVRVDFGAILARRE